MFLLHGFRLSVVPFWNVTPAKNEGSMYSKKTFLQPRYLLDNCRRSLFSRYAAPFPKHRSLIANKYKKTCNIATSKILTDIFVAEKLIGKKKKTNFLKTKFLKLNDFKAPKALFLDGIFKFLRKIPIITL